MTTDSSADYPPEHTSMPYVVVATAIFAVVSFTFLFPCNSLIPLDRRTIAVVGALACYLTRDFLFPSKSMDVLQAIDFEVLILLASIMIINHIVIHLRETKRLVQQIQAIIHANPIYGFWLVSLVAFAFSPFLTNDGVCLLFVEPILHIFKDLQCDPQRIKVDTTSTTNTATATTATATADPTNTQGQPLRNGDALYFLLALACSTNIGSALTYTGNPQNMIVASDALQVMPSYKFLAYMLLPSLVTWYMTIKWIERCWLRSRKEFVDPVPQSDTDEANPMVPLANDEENISSKANSKSLSLTLSACSPIESKSANKKSIEETSLLSPRRRLARERELSEKKAIRYVSSPIPYVVVALLAAMVILIFVDIMPISGLICLVSIVIVLIVVLGNHWRNNVLWDMENEQDYYFSSLAHGRQSTHRSVSNASTTVEVAESTDKSTMKLRQQTSSDVMNFDEHKAVDPDESSPVVKFSTQSTQSLGPMTKEDRLDNLNEFFDALFNSIDYSLLLIFLGTFVVVANITSTGLPRKLWNSIVGRVPFQTVASVIGISAFVLVTSQLLGNVALIQLAKPNIEYLEPASKRFAWALLSFIATIGGNLTITGSAANIIVAEKANRLDATIRMDFFRHYRVCFWITIASCFVGGALVAVLVTIDNNAGSHW